MRIVPGGVGRMPCERGRGLLRGFASVMICVTTGLAGCAGKSGGDDAPVAPGSTAIEYGLGAPQAALGQVPLSIERTPLVMTGRVRPQAVAVDSFAFPAGPDGAGDALPKVGGRYDATSAVYDQALGSKLWLDLPASAGGYQVAISVAQRLVPGGAADAPSEGTLLITPRTAYPDLTGRVRLAFGAEAAAPVCIGWDQDGNGSFEAETCTTIDMLASLWKSPWVGGALPTQVQGVASAGYAGWRRLNAQFDLALGAMHLAEGQYTALQAAAAGAIAAKVPCGLSAPSAAPGSYSIAWSDRNGSGHFDDGDDVRFTAGACWHPLDEGAANAPGRMLDGVFDLRAYERHVGAAPTFVGLRVTETVTVGSEITLMSAETVNGGFTLRVPGLDRLGDTLQGYPFESGNMLAAAGVAARSVAFYPDIGDLAYQALDGARLAPGGAKDLPICGNMGAATVRWSEGPAPNAAGLSAGDTVTLSLNGCDLGRVATVPRRHSGTLAFTLADVTWVSASEWGMKADLRFDLQTFTTQGGTRRFGELGVALSFVYGHSYLVNFRPEGWTGTQALSGVLASVRNGVPDFQLGCFGSADYYRGAWAWSDTQVLPNHVVKTADRVFTLGMRSGERFLMKADANGHYGPDTGMAGLIPISAPECVALGVPSSGVTGGSNRLDIVTEPAGDGDLVTLRLYGSSNQLLREQATNWSALVD